MNNISHTPFPDSGHDSGIGLEVTVPEFDTEERRLLELARSALSLNGFYAYVMLDEHQQWCVAADDEEGRVDVHADAGGYVVQVCSSSPGLFMEEESVWRRQALERLARRVVPNVARGMLDEHQTATWNDDDHGVSVCTSHQVAAESPGQVPLVARQALTRIDDLLTLVESQLRS
ncbi:hypothetical protein BH20CHL4_BH20CHL4_06050 [soil metagenome]